MTMGRQERITQIVQSKLSPVHFELENESYKHAVPENSETHFRMVVVSQYFEGLSRVQRSQKIHALLADELKSGLHALSQRLITPTEWQQMGQEVDSSTPDCGGHNKTKN